MDIIKFQLLVTLCVLDFYVESHRVELLDHTRLVQMARYLMHVADYAVVSSVTTSKWLDGSPYPNLKPMSDGIPSHATGVPYFYLSTLDFTTKNLQKDARCTVMVSMGIKTITRHCGEYNFDVDDPRCNIVLLIGKMKRITSRSSEYETARIALSTRHRNIQFPNGSEWFIAKLKITRVVVVDLLGRAKFINVNDFLNYQYPGNEVLFDYLIQSKTKSGENNKTLQELALMGVNTEESIKKRLTNKVAKKIGNYSTLQKTPSVASANITLQATIDAGNNDVKNLKETAVVGSNNSKTYETISAADLSSFKKTSQESADTGANNMKTVKDTASIDDEYILSTYIKTSQNSTDTDANKDKTVQETASVGDENIKKLTEAPRISGKNKNNLQNTPWLGTNTNDYKTLEGNTRLGDKDSLMMFMLKFLGNKFITFL